MFRHFGNNLICRFYFLLYSVRHRVTASENPPLF